VKLLRAIQERQFERVGGRSTVTVDVRIVAATNRDLEEATRAGTFRLDLYHRLHVVEIVLPALRERREDVLPLARHFLAELEREHGRRILLAPDAVEALCAHPWPGNVRQLRNALERAWALSGPNATFANLRLWLDPGAAQANASEVVDTSLPFKDAKERWNDQFERRYVAMVFAHHGNNVTRAAEHAGLSRRHFRELLYKHGIVERPAQDEAD
jgi:DNA-binding NtrC family response regulator